MHSSKKMLLKSLDKLQWFELEKNRNKLGIEI